MSTSDDSNESNEEQGDTLEEFANAFGATRDPLKEFEEVFRDIDRDPFTPFDEEILQSQNLNEATVRQYRSVFKEWQSFMQDQGRNPACPRDTHVVRFIKWQLKPEEDGGEDNLPQTVKGKLRKLNRAYEYWQDSPAFPHPQDYNPLQLGRQKVDLSNPNSKEYRRISVEELRDMMASVSNIRKRAIIGLQFKLGLRAGEVSNIKISDITLLNSEIQEHYPNMGTAKRITDRENAIYVPSKYERDNNKSECPKVLPLDDELRRLLTRYLLMRPDSGEPWLFLSLKSHSKLNSSSVSKVWKDEFHPKYGETEEYRAINSHFGRHRFTTWWRVERDVNRQLIKYMRGDKHNSMSGQSREAIDSYLHTYYEDIKDLYLEKIYKIGL